MRPSVLMLVFSFLLPAGTLAQTKPRPARPGAKPAPATPATPFKTTLTLDQMKGKQAVVETARGTFVIQLLPEAAPNHVGFFMAEAGKGAYEKTTFHRAVKMGIVQGGRPQHRHRL